MTTICWRSVSVTTTGHGKTASYGVHVVGLGSDTLLAVHVVGLP